MGPCQQGQVEDSEAKMQVKNFCQQNSNKYIITR